MNPLLFLEQSIWEPDIPIIASVQQSLALGEGMEYF